MKSTFVHIALSLTHFPCVQIDVDVKVSHAPPLSISMLFKDIVKKSQVFLSFAA